MPEAWAVAIITFLGTAVIGLVAYIFVRQQNSSERTAAKGEGAVTTLAALEARVSAHDREFREVKQEQALCDGKLAAFREEVGSRFERAASRIDAAERRQGEHESVVASALARLDATMNSLKESVDRLIAAENARAAQPKQGLGDVSHILEVMHLFAKLNPPSGAHAT